jgi:hypothetical protein
VLLAPIATMSSRSACAVAMAHANITIANHGVLACRQKVTGIIAVSHAARVPIKAIA